MSSITSTVLPTPAPPNIAALPPRASGSIRSITLMPVSKAVTAPLPDRRGGVPWIGRRGVPLGSGSPPSRIAPVTSISRPRTASPTGTSSGLPVACSFRPRDKPSVDCSAMARTRCASRWPCTSKLPGMSSSVSVRIEWIGGSGPSKLASMTGPRTAMIRPSVVLIARYIRRRRGDSCRSRSSRHPTAGSRSAPRPPRACRAVPPDAARPASPSPQAPAPTEAASR